MNGQITFNRIQRFGVLLSALLLVSAMVIPLLPDLNAQTTDPPQDIDVRPLSEVYGEGAPRIANLVATSAAVEFVSSIPLACSVVYGMDDTFGQIATDANMMGGVHTDHRPMLTNLTPDTEYVYRVQGSDANGVIYVSDVMTFRTPPEEDTGSPNEINVAEVDSGAEVVAVSSNFGNAANDGTWGAESAFDGKEATAWSSNGDGDDAFIEVHLGKPASVNVLPSTVEVWTRRMSDGSAQIFEFSLTSNPDAADSEHFGPFTLPDANQAYRFEIAPTQEVASLRLDVERSSGGNTGLVEFRVIVDSTVTATNTTNMDLFLPLVTQ